MTPNVYPETCQCEEKESVGQFCIVMKPNKKTFLVEIIAIYNNVSW